MKEKKKLSDLTDKDKRRLGIIEPKELNTCFCITPKPRSYITEMFEPYELCDKCKKEII